MAAFVQIGIEGRVTPYILRQNPYHVCLTSGIGKVSRLEYSIPSELERYLVSALLFRLSIPLSPLQQSHIERGRTHYSPYVYVLRCLASCAKSCWTIPHITTTKLTCRGLRGCLRRPAWRRGPAGRGAGRRSWGCPRSCPCSRSRRTACPRWPRCRGRGTWTSPGGKGHVQVISALKGEVA